MNKMTTIRATGAKMKVPFLQNLVPIEGDDIEITIVRQVNYWFSKKKIPEFYTITIKQKGEGDTTNDEVIVEK